jgi:hypothetical protein
MGVMMAPVAGSGSWPAWMARVSNAVSFQFVVMVAVAPAGVD